EDLDPETYERTHVHSVYEAIAPHFSATRYKPWPVVSDFLLAQPAGAVGLDVGCGNGKYLGVNPNVFLVGSDRSASLVALARQHGQPVQGPAGHVHLRGGQGTAADPSAASSAADTEVLVADGLSLPFRSRTMDFAICVAVLHHLSTRERRQQAIRHLLDCIRRPDRQETDGSRGALLYVWALEQGTSRRGWEEGGEQDLLVPWVMKSQQQKRAKRKGGDEAAAGEDQAPSEDGSEKRDQTFQRYYHLYREGELEEDVRAVGGRVLRNGYDRDNWWAIAAD
ncbi:S-adenosyl-L-methionine-dependent methyltransferase, partial [Thozetella sp. PMI_491]